MTKYVMLPMLREYEDGKPVDFLAANDAEAHAIGHKLAKRVPDCIAFSVQKVVVDRKPM